jgi:hypothetical protein
VMKHRFPCLRGACVMALLAGCGGGATTGRETAVNEPVRTHRGSESPVVRRQVAVASVLPCVVDGAASSSGPVGAIVRAGSGWACLGPDCDWGDGWRSMWPAEGVSYWSPDGTVTCACASGRIDCHMRSRAPIPMPESAGPSSRVVDVAVSSTAICLTSAEPNEIACVLRDSVSSPWESSAGSWSRSLAETAYSVAIVGGHVVVPGLSQTSVFSLVSGAQEGSLPPAVEAIVGRGVCLLDADQRLDCYETVPGVREHVLGDVAQACGANGTTCALLQSGEVYCLGNNANSLSDEAACGQAGRDDLPEVQAPTRVSLNGPARELACGPTLNCARMDQGWLCWGRVAGRRRPGCTASPVPQEPSLGD